MALTDTNIVVGAATVSLDGVDVGHTKGGATFRYEPDFFDVISDQSVGVVVKPRSLERMFVTTTFLEMTLANIRKALMQPIENLSGSTLTLGYNNVCWVDEVVIVLVGKSPNCGTRTVTFNKAVSIGVKEYNFSREEESSLEVEFECLKDSNGEFGSIIDT